jgi:serine/threonine protein phosphatase PrpC
MLLKHIDNLLDGPPVDNSTDETTPTMAKTPAISITTDLVQLCKGEDTVPCFLKNDRSIACIVADGHGGKGCTKTIDDNAESILSTVLANGVEAGMTVCANLCSQKYSGAMVIITRFDIPDRTLQIISMGDASCTVYQHQQLLHAQPHHDCETVANMWPEEAATIGVRLQPPQPTMIPMMDGKTMVVQPRRAYFKWRSGHLIQSASFVGHQGLSRLKPCLTEIVVPEGPFHMVMATDGVFDVVHPEDRLLTSAQCTAEAVVEAAKQRWTEPYFNAIEQEEFKHFNSEEGYFVFNSVATVVAQHALCNSRNVRIKEQQTNPDGSVRVTFINGVENNIDPTLIQEIERNVGADDISALVMRISN